MKMKIARLVLTIMLFAVSLTASAQKFAVSTNTLDIINLGTINLQANYAVAQHWTLTLQGRYNNWSFGSVEKGNPFQNRSRGGALGARYWFWYTYSGWWVAANARFDEYNRGGLFGMTETEEGRALGAGLAVGYSRMLSEHWNLDFGLGAWAGGTKYTTYACPRCGMLLDQGTKFFALPSPDCQVSFVYIF